MENISIKERNKTAMIYGALVGFINIIIFSAVNLFVGNFIMYYVLLFTGFLAYMVLVGIFAGRIRKANGGFISFKDIFGAIFIMMLISSFIYFIYSFIYFKFIDPEFIDKMKNGTLTWMEKMKVSEDQLEKTIKKFDDQAAESKNFSFGKNVIGFLSNVVLNSLFGLIVAAIVKKNKPVFQ